MTTAVFAKAGQTADKVRAEARSLDPMRVVLTLLVIPFVVAGWVARMVVRAVWMVLSYSWSAVVVGWEEAAPRERERT